MNASALRNSFAYEFADVSNKARRLGGRRIVGLARGLEEASATVVRLVEPPDDRGLSEADQKQLRRVLDDLLAAATSATRRKRWVQGLVVTALITGAAVGFVAGLLVDWFN